MKIDLIDSIECRVSKKDAQKLIPCLSYKAVFWRKGQFSKKRTEYRKQCFSHKTKDYWYFYTGHLKRVRKFCEKRGIEFYFYPETYPEEPFIKPSIPGITLREDQKRIINKSLVHQTGVIKAPTGTGKTILQLGIISAFKSRNILLLAHTSSIVNQTIDKIRELEWDCTQIGGGVGGEFSIYDKIVIATIQSFAKIDPNKYSTFFDVVIVDEAHRVSSFNGLYHKVLSNLLAPVRLGFTATLPYKEEAKMALEGLIGPLITEQTINEAAEKKILAVPKIKIIKSRLKQRVKELRNYQEVYQKGIVENLSRNKQIVDIVINHKEKKQSTLIFVNKIEHGKNLIKLFKKREVNIPFIKGDMPNERREVIKKSLIKKKRLVVIATTAWKEGVDIPSLDVVFNAGGGKSEIATLQSIGRGLRRTDEKDLVIIYDFFDPSHNFLISHFGERVSLYCKNNWL